jgi:hypothetical protein|tara:strand:+ start:116 stop:925 length:810 start_codon:yes stop_codon:yes gene_type:complete
MKKPNVKYDLVLVTPKKAEELLKLNTKNRKINDNNVDQYASDMRSGDFRFNGSSICLSNTNVLIDGQQRLTACIKSEKPFWTLMIENMEESAMDTIDNGRKRTYSDRLKIRGYENSSALAATVSMLALISEGQPKHRGYTPVQLDRVLDKNPSVAESAQYAKKTFHKADTLLGAIHYIAKQTGYDDEADEFVRTWKDGQKNYEDDPIVYIRDQLIKDQTRIKKMTTVHRMKLIMRSWTKFSSYEPLKNAKLSSDSFSMEGWTPVKAGLK